MYACQGNGTKVLFIVILIGVVGTLMWILTCLQERLNPTAVSWESWDTKQQQAQRHQLSGGLINSSFTLIQDPDHCRRQCNALCLRQQEPVSTEPIPEIWFIESTLQNGKCLSERQACAVESAALQNRNLTVNLLITGSMAFPCSTLSALNTLPNFRATFFDVRKEFRGTPLEPWYTKGRWKTAPHKVEDMSDALRWLVLWKHGGIYLDHDLIVLKSLKSLKNGGAYEGPGFPGVSALFFDKRHPFVSEVLATCVREYDIQVWGSCGPTLFHHVYNKWNAVPSSPVRILPRETFYPIHYNDWHKFFDANLTGEVFHAVRNSFGVHLWNKFSHMVPAEVGSGTAYDVLARFNCPLIYEAMVARKVI